MSKKPKEADGDWLKYYCIVFALLTVVVGVMYFKIKGDLDDYERANKQALTLLDPEREVDLPADETPRTIPALALAVKKYVSAYEAAIGGAEGREISTSIIDKARVQAEIGPPREGNMSDTKNPRGGYVTIYRDFTFPESPLDNLARLVYNIETHRYRVFELKWTLLDNQEGHPKFRVRSPILKVGFRKPISSTE